LRERAVRLVQESRAEHASEWEAMRSVAQKLGIGTTETVRKWVRRAEVDDPHHALALANAGVRLDGQTLRAAAGSPVTIGVVVALVVGRRP
jgi:transposase-like protein